MSDTAEAELLTQRRGTTALITLHRPDTFDALTPTMISGLVDTSALRR